MGWLDGPVVWEPELDSIGSPILVWTSASTLTLYWIGWVAGEGAGTGGFVGSQDYAVVGNTFAPVGSPAQAFIIEGLYIQSGSRIYAAERNADGSTLIFVDPGAST